MSAALPSVEQAETLRGTRVLLRASLNVPIKGGNVANDFRLRAALPTLQHLLDAGARVIVVGHIGRDPQLSLKPVCEELNKHVPVMFIGDVVGERASAAVRTLKDGEALMLENVRSHPGERENSRAFADALAALADVYVNDAFSACHREHASIVGVPKILPHYAGMQLIREVEELTRALKPETPSVFVLGGAKFETKRPLIEKMLGVYDTIFVGGALANDFLSAMGYSVGTSATSKDTHSIAGMIGRPDILLPRDVVVSKGDDFRIAAIDDVHEDEYISDVGPKTLELLAGRLQKAKYVLWNGPLGDTELGFTSGTEELAKTIARSDAESIVGGGDTIASIANLNLERELSFISTGGGSMLQFLAYETLPGIEALRQ